MATHIRPARKGDEAALSRVKYLANKNNPDKLFNTPGYNDPKNEDWLITRGVACFTMKVAKGTVVLAETADGEIVGLAEWILPQEMEEEEEEAADDLQAKVQSSEFPRLAIPDYADLFFDKPLLIYSMNTVGR